MERTVWIENDSPVAFSASQSESFNNLHCMAEIEGLEYVCIAIHQIKLSLTGEENKNAHTLNFL